MHRNTVLLANVSHYHYLAQALEEAGLLQKYITSLALTGNETLPSWVPGDLRRKLEGRRVRGVPPERVDRVWLPEVLLRAISDRGWCSREKGDSIKNRWFDRWSRARVGECGVLHFVSTTGLYSAREAKRRGATIVCDCRESNPRYVRDVMMAESARTGIPVQLPDTLYADRLVEEALLADHIVVPSRFAARSFERLCPATPIHVIPYGVDLNYFAPVLPDPPSRFRVLFCGRACLQKGVHHLLEAFEKLRLPGAELLIVGAVDGDLADFLACRASLFRHVPTLPKLDLPDYYASSSVLVIPSIADAYPLVVGEALACGLPVIASDAVGSGDLIEDGREGFIVPAGSADAIAEKLLLLYRDAERQRSMRKAAAARARQSGWDRYRARIVDLYREIPGGPGEPRPLRDQVPVVAR